MLKDRIRTITKKYSKKHVNEEKVVIAQLSEIVSGYESNLPLNREDMNLYEESKAELEEKSLERIRGVMFRSKVKWYEEGEKSSKYFFSLEKARYNAKTCYKMIDDSGKEIDAPKEILNQQRTFYQQLYNQDEDVNFSVNNSSGIKVPEDIHKTQQEQISIYDLEVAIKSMKNSKTPGIDGLPIDFYKVFWTQIKQAFYEMMIESYDIQLLPSHS